MTSLDLRTKRGGRPSRVRRRPALVLDDEAARAVASTPPTLQRSASLTQPRSTPLTAAQERECARSSSMADTLTGARVLHHFPGHGAHEGTVTGASPPAVLGGPYLHDIRWGDDTSSETWAFVHSARAAYVQRQLQLPPQQRHPTHPQQQHSRQQQRQQQPQQCAISTVRSLGSRVLAYMSQLCRCCLSACHHKSWHFLCMRSHGSDALSPVAPIHRFEARRVGGWRTIFFQGIALKQYAVG